MYVSNILMSKLHQKWAEGKRKQIDKTTGKPFEQVWKKTGCPEYDQEILEKYNKGEAIPDTVKVENGVVKIDILNLPFKDLTTPWKSENQAAAIAAEETLGVDNMFLKRCCDAVDNLSPSDLEILASHIHDRWMQRRMEEKSKDPNAWIDESLMVPYSELSREEQLKDMEHVLMGIDIAETVRKILTVDHYLDRSYIDKPVFKENGKLNYPENARFAGSGLHLLPKFNDAEILMACDMFGKNSDTTRYIMMERREEKKAETKLDKEVKEKEPVFGI